MKKAKHYLMNIFSQIFLVAILFMLTACGPYKEIMDIEVNQPSSVKTDVLGKSIAICYNGDVSAENLLFFQGISKGIGNVLNVVNKNPEYEIIIDSLALGDMFHKIGLDYGESTLSLVMSMPYQFNISISKKNDTLDKTPEQIKFSDIVYWNIVAPDTVSIEKFYLKAKNSLPSLYVGLGEIVASDFFPKWKPEERTIICYLYGRWAQAEELAFDFKWKEARDIWMKLVDTDDVKKKGIASYNIALACEMLQQYEIALKWLDYVDKYMPGLKEAQQIRERCMSFRD